MSTSRISALIRALRNDALHAPPPRAYCRWITTPHHHRFPHGRTLLLLLVTSCRPGEPATSRAGPIASVPPPAGSAVSAQNSRARTSARSTPERILCGATQCQLATEVCCAALSGAGRRCVPRPSDPSQDPCGEGELTKYCDGAEDCAGGACCATALCTGGCPPLHACESPRCESEPGGVCVPGGVCPVGFVCSLPGAAEGREQGHCVLQTPGVTCGTKRCAGATPVCCWSAATQTGTCAAACPGDGAGDVAALSCATNADCAGYACGRFSSSPAQIYSCAGHSFAGDRFDPILCGSVSDCPKHFGNTATACAKTDATNLPPNVKVCQYDDT
jgi:hypothetical protein